MNTRYHSLSTHFVVVLQHGALDMHSDLAATTKSCLFFVSYCPLLWQHGTSPETPQVCFFSATLHSPEIAKLADSICDRPTWVDLKGRDTVPQTVHHVVVRVDPDKDGEVGPVPAKAKVQPRTDGVCAGSEGRDEERAEKLKRMKPQVRGIDTRTSIAQRPMSAKRVGQRYLGGKLPTVVGFWFGSSG